MADVKISALPTASVVNAGDILVLNQGGTTKTATKSLVVAGLTTTSQVAAITTQQLSAISISAGSGLTGGGPLSANSTMSLAALSPAPTGNYGSSSQIPVLTVNQFGQITGVTTQQNPSAARTKVVGIDASTIQGCLDLITDATSSNPAQVLIPPGIYTENVTFKGSVLVSALGNNNAQTNTVRINGTHSFAGGATAANNLLQLTGLVLNSASLTTPTLSLTTQAGVTAIVHLQNCAVSNAGVSTSCVGVYVGPDVILNATNVRSDAYSVGAQGGIHFDINGGSLYTFNLATEFGSCVVLLRGTNGAYKPYAQILNSTLSCNGPSVINITSATALLTAGWSSFTNYSTTGSGVYIAAGSVAGIYGSNFAIQSGASNYIVTGAAGCAYYQLNNGYSNATGALYETKIAPTVAQFLYSSSTYYTGSKTYDAPSLTTGTSTTTTVSCPGATTAHFAEATLSTNTGANGLTLYAYVSAADTVTVRLTNQTAGTVDLGSGTLKVRTSL
jgi:hypothetical protein